MCGVSCLSIAVTELQSQDNLVKEGLVWVLRCQRREVRLPTWCLERVRSWDLRAHISNSKQGAKRADSKWLEPFEASKPAPSDLFPPVRPLVPILSKQPHQLWTKNLNAWDLRETSHSNQHAGTHKKPQSVVKSDWNVGVLETSHLWPESEAQEFLGDKGVPRTCYTYWLITEFKNELNLRKPRW